MSHLWGKSMFAPVGRGAPGHPDRGRQRHERQEDGPFAGAQPVQHQQGDQAQHVVPRPTRASPDGRTGRSVRRRAAATSPAPRGARPTAGAPNHAGATARHANACGRGWRRGRGGGRTSRFPIPGRVPISERPPPAGARRRHVRRRRRVRPPHAPARRAGHGHVASPTHTPAGGGEATRTGTA